VPYLTTAIFICSICEKDAKLPQQWNIEYKCCGIRKRVYWFEDGMKAFLMDTFGYKRKDMKRGICLAYNMRNFDGYFILSTLLNAGAPLSKVVLAGQRLLSMTFNGVQMKDLNMYCQGSLANLPRSFGLDKMISKGHFPHLLADTLTFPEMKTYSTPNHPPFYM
jgi:hypothetical protein